MSHGSNSSVVMTLRNVNTHVRLWYMWYPKLRKRFCQRFWSRWSCDIRLESDSIFSGSCQEIADEFGRSCVFGFESCCCGCTEVGRRFYLQWNFNHNHRNLSVVGGFEVCDYLIAKDCMTLLLSALHQVWLVLIVGVNFADLFQICNSDCRDARHPRIQRRKKSSDCVDDSSDCTPHQFEVTFYYRLFFIDKKLVRVRTKQLLWSSGIIRYLVPLISWGQICFPWNCA